LLEWAETARIHFSGLSAGVGVMAHLQARAEPTQGHCGALTQPACQSCFLRRIRCRLIGRAPTPEKPGPQTNLIPALARAKPQTGQVHLEVSRNCELDREFLFVAPL